jgi:TRAP transporter TAXI family solute receptor
MLTKREKITGWEKVKVFGPAVLLTLIGFYVAYRFVGPAPPRHISISAGARDSAYFTYAKAYSEILYRSGIDLEITTTAGSVENLQLLEAESGGVDVAFIQGGIGALSQSDDIVSLGSLYYEPLWIFHQAGIKLKRLVDLKGLRVAVGKEGSGTRILVMKLLGRNGITVDNTRILSYGHQKAADMLLNGKVDVAFFVSTHRAPYFPKLFKSRSIALMGLERAEAYALHYHYLHVGELPEGVLDFETNIPPRDLKLVAPTTQLVARSDLHPALINILLQAAKEIHSKGGGLERKGEFPSPNYIDFKLNKEAERFYESGPTLLQRYFPFWVANFLARMKIMLLPMLALLYPLFKTMPLIYRWRVRSRIYRWYSELDAVDPDNYKTDIASHLDEDMAELDRIEKNVSNISVPHAYSEELFHLRLHIELLRNKLIKMSSKG